MLLGILMGLLVLWIPYNKWGQENSCNEDEKKKPTQS